MTLAKKHLKQTMVSLNLPLPSSIQEMSRTISVALTQTLKVENRILLSRLACVLAPFVTFLSSFAEQTWPYAGVALVYTIGICYKLEMTENRVEAFTKADAQSPEQKIYESTKDKHDDPVGSIAGEVSKYVTIEIASNNAEVLNDTVSDIKSVIRKTSLGNWTNCNYPQHRSVHFAFYGLRDAVASANAVRNKFETPEVTVSFTPSPFTGIQIPIGIDPLRGLDSKMIKKHLTPVSKFRDSVLKAIKGLDEAKQGHPLMFTIPLDPRLHAMPGLTTDQQVVVKQALEDEMMQTNSQDEEQTPSIGDNDLMQAAMQHSKNNIRKHSTLEHYLSECNNAQENEYLPADPLIFWGDEQIQKKFCKLSRVARKWLAASLICPIPSCQYYTIPETEQAEASLFLKLNWHLSKTD